MAPLRPMRLLPVERLRQALHHHGRHGRVDLAGELDEARVQAVFARLPGEIERVDRDAVPAEPRPRIEGHEAERLGLGRLDHLPDVDAHGRVDHLELVDEGDVDGPKNVLGDLDRLGRRGRRDRHDAAHHLLVEGARQGERFGVVGADHLWDGRRLEGFVARVLALGREGEEEVGPGLEAAALEDRLHHIRDGAGIGGRFEHHELAGAEMLGDRLAGLHHVGQVRLAVAVERGRHADDAGVDGADPREIRGRREAAVRDEIAEHLGVEVPDIGDAAGQLLDLAGIDVEAGAVKAIAGEGPRQGQADIAEADDADPERSVGDAVK